MPRINKQDWQKTDKLDSRNLCKHLSDDNLKGIYIPEEEQEQLRSLFRRRILLARQVRTIKNHIKSQLLYYGIKLPEEYDNPNWNSLLAAVYLRRLGNRNGLCTKPLYSVQYSWCLFKCVM